MTGMWYDDAWLPWRRSPEALLHLPQTLHSTNRHNHRCPSPSSSYHFISNRIQFISFTKNEKWEWEWSESAVATQVNWLFYAATPTRRRPITSQSIHVWRSFIHFRLLWEITFVCYQWANIDIICWRRPWKMDGILNILATRNVRSRRRRICVTTQQSFHTEHRILAIHVLIIASIYA